MKLSIGPAAVPPGGNDEIGQDENVSGQRYAEDEFEEEDEVPDDLSIGGGDGRSEGGVSIVDSGPLPIATCGELVAFNTRLLLVLGLVTTLDLTLIQATLNANSEGIWDLCWEFHACEG